MYDKCKYKVFLKILPTILMKIYSEYIQKHKLEPLLHSQPILHNRDTPQSYSAPCPLIFPGTCIFPIKRPDAPRMVIIRRMIYHTVFPPSVNSGRSPPFHRRNPFIYRPLRNAMSSVRHPIGTNIRMQVQILNPSQGNPTDNDHPTRIMQSG